MITTVIYVTEDGEYVPKSEITNNNHIKLKTDIVYTNHDGLTLKQISYVIKKRTTDAIEQLLF